MNDKLVNDMKATENNSIKDSWSISSKTFMAVALCAINYNAALKIGNTIKSAPGTSRPCSRQVKYITPSKKWPGPMSTLSTLVKYAVLTPENVGTIRYIIPATQKNNMYAV